jgi:hypothetical protein
MTVPGLPYGYDYTMAGRMSSRADCPETDMDATKARNGARSVRTFRFCPFRVFVAFYLGIRGRSALGFGV